MSDINCFFFPSSSLKNSFVATAMKKFFNSNKKKIIDLGRTSFQFIYQSFQHVFGINHFCLADAYANGTDSIPTIVEFNLSS